MDVCARTLLAVEKMINDKKLSNYVAERYEDWQKDLGQFIHDKVLLLMQFIKKSLMINLNLSQIWQSRYLENILNKYL